jgi:hypothetical protein
MADAREGLTKSKLAEAEVPAGKSQLILRDADVPGLGDVLSPPQ